MEPQLIRKEPLGNNVFINVSKHHAFGTDAILLSNFADARRSDRLVDLGTGCGIIPFVIYRNGGVESAVGVDISAEAVSLARKTAEELQLQNFSVIESNITELKGKIEFGRHTLVTCNPPYKAAGAGITNPDNVDAVARHELECTLEDIVCVASKLLQTSGRLCMCHRPERLSQLMALMSKYKIEPKRLRLVCQRQGEEPWLCLVEGKKCAKTGLRIAPTLYVEENGKLSREMTEIYGSYKEGHL